MDYSNGQRFKCFSTFDLDKVGSYDIFEVAELDGELCFVNLSTAEVFDLNFLGHSELVPIIEENV